MSVQRQSDLLSGEAWDTIYTAFTQVNFNATDPVSIDAAMRDYIRVNYPESFNDWVLSSEFVAIIDLLAWISGTLAFKTDISARENFLDVAESRESILRLARFLSYNPSRCQSSTGLLKIVQVATDDDVIDSFGVDLINTPVLWNDTNNFNWYEQFTLILNNAFVQTNPFGVPIASGTVGDIETELYRLNGFASGSNRSFSSIASGTPMDFEVCNADFNDNGTWFERDPDPANAMQFYYLNDGLGNASAQSGFFLLFKQGTTSQQTFSIDYPVQNQVIDIAATNVNQNDVWVQTVDDLGSVLIDWKKVSTIDNASNIIYNNLPADERYIFSVITRDNDQISIRFADGNFGNAPVGNIRVIYRVSNGLTYVINPSEIDNLALALSYTNSSGVAHTLTVTFSLYSQVANSASAETIEQIRQRAPQVYATQNRMVSGEDYNTYPTSTNLAVKIKAVNRLYSGQSRYIDLHDPTGTYQDLTIFAEDGILFQDAADTYYEIPTSLGLTAVQLFTNYIQPTIDQYTTANLLRDVLMRNVLAGNIVVPDGAGSVLLSTLIPTHLTWTASTAPLFTSTGSFSLQNVLIQPGAMIQFSIRNTPTWVAVLAVQSEIDISPLPNTAGPVTLSHIVPSGSPILAILPQVTTTLPPAVIAAVQSKLSNRLSFSLWYDYQTNGGTWSVQNPQSDFGPPIADLSNLPLASLPHPTTIPIMNINYMTGLWRIASRGMRYVFESQSAVQWYDNGKRGLAQLTGEAKNDLVKVLRINQDLHTDSRGFALDNASDFVIDRIWSYPDGTPEVRRTVVLLADENADGYPDHPDSFYNIVSDATESTYLFWSNQDNPPYEQPIYNVVVYDTDSTRQTVLTATGSAGAGTTQIAISGATSGLSVGMTVANANIVAGTVVTGVTPTGIFISIATTGPFAAAAMQFGPPLGTIAYQVLSTVSYLLNGTFWVMQATGWQQETASFRAAIGRGPNHAAAWVTADTVASGSSILPYTDSLAFQWQHYAPSDHRINPASTNIIDIFVLTYAYDAAVRQWIANGAVLTKEPSAPTELDLKIAFASLETSKMFSDTIVWRPVRYKYLFGKSADPSVQAQFKVVRAANSAVSDGEIRSQIIAAINAFFAISLWDFGETFYFTELAAFVHQQLVGLINSIVLVPLAANAAFGDGFEISCGADEIFISTAGLGDITLISANTATNLRIA